MTNLRFAIFNLSPQGAMTLAHQTLFDKVEDANSAINNEILPAYDASQREALHNDIKLDSIQQSPNAEVLAGIRKTLEEKDASIVLNTVNLVVLPVNDIVTLNFTLNAKTYAEIAESPVQPDDATDQETLAANDAAPADEEEKAADEAAKGVKEEPVSSPEKD